MEKHETELNEQELETVTGGFQHLYTVHNPYTKCPYCGYDISDIKLIDTRTCCPGCDKKLW